MRGLKWSSDRLGLRLLGIWLVAWGVLILAPGLSFAAKDTLLAVLALVAGILLLLDR